MGRGPSLQSHFPPGAQLLPPAKALDAIADRILRAKSSAQPVALGALTFAGAFLHGAKAAGCKIAGGIEIEECLLGERVQQQLAPVAVIPMAELPKAAALLRSTGAVPDLLLMNPPCSAYAKNGKRGGMEDPIMCNLHACIEFAFALAPNAWCWELVPGIWDRDKEFVTDLAARAAKVGYKCYAFLTSAAVHGGNQKRDRFHFIASRFELDFDACLADQPPERLGWRSLRQALDGLTDGLPNSRTVRAGAMDAILPYVPPGTYINQLPDDLLTELYKPNRQRWNAATMGRPGVSRIRGHWDLPSATIVGGPSVVHPDHDRFLTVRENARLMGFPDDIVMSEGSQGYAECGKGVTVATATFVCDVLARGVRTSPASSVGETLVVVDYRPKSAAPGLTTDNAYKDEWYQARHGRPWPGGRRTTSSNAKPRGRPPSVVTQRIATDAEAVRRRCLELGVECVPLSTATSTDVAVACATDSTTAFAQAFALGASKAVRRILTGFTPPCELPGVESMPEIDDVLAIISAKAEPANRARLLAIIGAVPGGHLAAILKFVSELVDAESLIEAPSGEPTPAEDEDVDDDPSADTPLDEEPEDGED